MMPFFLLLGRAKWVILAVVGLIGLGIGWQAWKVWHRPPPLPSVLETIKPQADRTVAAAARRVQDQLKAQERQLKALQKSLADREAAIGRELDRTLLDAEKGGPDALATLATDWFRPGRLAEFQRELASRRSRP